MKSTVSLQEGHIPTPPASCHFPKETPVCETKLSAQNTVEGEGEKNPAGLVLSHGTSFFQKPQTLGGLDTDSAIQLATRLGTDSCVRASKTPASPEIPSGSWLDNFVPEL